MKVDSANYMLQFTDEDKGLLSRHGYHIVKVGNGIRWRQDGVRGFISQNKVEDQLFNLKNGKLSEKTAVNILPEESRITERIDQVVDNVKIDEVIPKIVSSYTEPNNIADAELHKNAHDLHSELKTDFVKNGISVAVDLLPKLFKQVLKHKENVANSKYSGLEIIHNILKDLIKIFEKIVYVFSSKQTQINENVKSEADDFDDAISDGNLSECDTAYAEEIETENCQQIVKSEQNIENNDLVDENNFQEK